jgi:E-phenylitaconyl-CoA hydratase
LTVEYSVEGNVGRVVLNRPEKLNALTAAMRARLAEVIADAQADERVWILVLQANGSAFSVGLDLNELETGEGAAAPSIEELYLSLHGFYKPIVSLIQGYCLAQGAGLALFTDIRIASSEAKFGWPQVRRGITSVSGPAILAHALPSGPAMELLMTGELIGSERALELNLVNRVVPEEQLGSAGEEMITRLRAGAPLAARAIKEAVRRGGELALPERLALGARTLEEIKATEDAAEGLSAFREKRAPRWKGR